MLHEPIPRHPCGHVPFGGIITRDEELQARQCSNAHAQLPNLKTNHEQYKVTALCDVSLDALKLCSERFHVENTFTSV
jgi:hypothetical protein